MRDLILGMDIGGSKCLTGLITPEGRVVDRIKEATNPHSLPAVSLDRLTASARHLLERNGLKTGDLLGIAAGCPGPLDFKSGMLRETPNLDWKNLSLRQALTERLGVPVFLDNDGNMAALAEYYYGASKGCQHLLYMTISTGIGGGIILNGEIYRGIGGGAGEFGHMIVEPLGRDCKCGGKGCLEAVASGTAIARDAQVLIEQGQWYAIQAISLHEPISARLVGEAARQGDAIALSLIKQAAAYLGIGIANLISIFNPERVILGGGVGIGMQDLLLVPIQTLVNEHVFRFHQESVRIEMTSLGDEGALMGCAAAVLKNREKRQGGKECDE